MSGAASLASGPSERPSEPVPTASAPRLVLPTTPTELRDTLAAIEHQRWASWQAWLHAQGTRHEDGSITLPADRVAAWERQIATPYEALSDRERASDLEQVDRYWPLLVDLHTDNVELLERAAATTATLLVRARSGEYPCPFFNCMGRVKLTWEEEHGEFGTVLSALPTFTSTCEGERNDQFYTYAEGVTTAGTWEHEYERDTTLSYGSEGDVVDNGPVNHGARLTWFVLEQDAWDAPEVARVLGMSAERRHVASYLEGVHQVVQHQARWLRGEVAAWRGQGT
jgi:hypothetical protein